MPQRAKLFSTALEYVGTPGRLAEQRWYRKYLRQRRYFIRFHSFHAVGYLGRCQWLAALPQHVAQGLHLLGQLGGLGLGGVSSRLSA